MSKSSTVALAGGALVAVNVWTGPQRHALADVLNGKSGSSDAGHKALLQIGGEAVAILVATIAAGSSDAVGTGMIAAVVALWILWAIHYYANPKSKPPARAAGTPAASA